MGLRAKFNAVLLGACLIGILAASTLSFWVVQRSAIHEIEQEIRLLRANALAVRHFTSTGIAPLLSEESDILFLPQSVPSYTAQTVFSIFRDEFPEYRYKEAALNPTNPADLATPWEAQLINDLRADPSLDRVWTVREEDGERFFTVAFPMQVTSEGCLYCHSTPDVAPVAMVDLYGSENGFGWQLDEIIGAQIVSAPMSLADTRAQETVTVLVLGLTGAFLLVLIVTNVMLSRIVLRPVTRMSQMAEKVSLGDFSQSEYVKPGRDEISVLSVSFNRMRRSLESAMKLLDE
ncbi:MAG: DUF3365 domain-containing protein [Pseudomonadota bacterium]